LLHVEAREREELEMELGVVETEDMMLPFDDRREDARDDVDCDLLSGEIGDWDVTTAKCVSGGGNAMSLLNRGSGSNSSSISYEPSGSGGSGFSKKRWPG
jgi:hypothetical protein